MKNKNKKRADRIRKVLKGYSGPDSDLKTDIVDALVDIRHLCAEKKFMFGVMDATAFDHYVAEKEE